MGQGEGKMGELLFSGCGVSFGKDEKVLEMNGGDNCTTL